MPNQVTINVNTQASVAMVERLKSLHRSGLPLAIRGTLNAAAFDVKMNTLDDSATQNFIRRSPTFFKRFSGVERAQGFDVNSMRATVGMTANGVPRAETAVRNMEKQEYGGKITEGLDYLAAARTSRDLDRPVQTRKRFDRTNVVRGKFKYPGTTKSRKIAAAYVALREDKYQKVKIGSRNFYRIVTSVRKLTKGRVKVNSRLIYVSRSGSIQPIKPTHFAREAAERTQPKIPYFFNKEAQKQINRLWK
jgi:hypothetical protein